MSIDATELVKVIMSASWPDGGHDGFPSSRTAELIADVLIPYIERAKAIEVERLGDELKRAYVRVDANGEALAHVQRERDALRAQVERVEKVCADFQVMNAKNEDVKFGAMAVVRHVYGALTEPTA